MKKNLKLAISILTAAIIILTAVCSGAAYTVNSAYSVGAAYIVNSAYSVGAASYIGTASSVSTASSVGASSAVAASAANPVKPAADGVIIVMKLDSRFMSVNGKTVEVDPGRETTPILLNDRTMVPARALTEAIGGTVDWYEVTERIALWVDGNVLTMTLNSNSYVINGAEKTMDVAPTELNGRTYIPLRFASEALGCGVTWVEATNEIIVVYKPGAAPANGEEELINDIKQTVDNILADKNKALSESELLSVIRTASGYAIDNYIYIDMDHDGNKELLGAFSDKSGYYQVWFCNSDGSVCKKVHQNDASMDDCIFMPLVFDDETHVAFNAYMEMGTMENYSILALRGADIKALVANQYGYVRMTMSGDITLDVENYDGMYDASIDSTILHTWKDTYLYFDGTEYKEYGATAISEAEFLTYENAANIIEAIRAERTGPETKRLELTYYRRKNGIMHVQCDEYCYSGDIYYGYYTVRYEGKRIAGGAEEYNSGVMSPYFSSLKVTY